LSAALILGRARRRVLVCDCGEYRNAAARGVHGFLGHEGIAPEELRRLGREQLAPLAVELRRVTVVDAKRNDDGFDVTLDDATRLRSKMLLLATGSVDRVPDLESLPELYGRSVFHCPYCDGWEIRDQPVAAYRRGERGLKLALALTTWSRDVVLCTDGRSRLRHDGLERLSRHGVTVRTERIARLEGRDGVLERILFKAGAPLARSAMFFKTGHDQRSDLPARLGCTFTKGGAVKTTSLEGTQIPGLYVTGDAAEDVQLAIIAAAEGAKAGFAINDALQKQELA
jgi:thioredoxin reductase